MRTNARFSFALLCVASATLAGACGSETAGVDACRRIETARCEAATACGVSEGDSKYCVEFYLDQCLHGFAKPMDPSEATVTACTDAIHAVAECARVGAQSMTQCPTIALVAGSNPAALLPCTIIEHTPAVLEACAFITPDTPTLDAGTTPDSSSDAASDADAMIN